MVVPQIGLHSLTEQHMKKYNLNRLAGTVKRLRAAAKLTRQELSEKAKVNYNTIIKIESGANKNPTAKTLIGLSKVFKKTLEDLLT